MRHRLQFDVEDEQLRWIDSLKEQARASSRAEVVRDALRLYQWLLEQRKSGYEIELRKGRKLKTVELLLLS